MNKLKLKFLLSSFAFSSSRLKLLLSSVFYSSIYSVHTENHLIFHSEGTKAPLMLKYIFTHTRLAPVTLLSRAHFTSTPADKIDLKKTFIIFSFSFKTRTHVNKIFHLHFTQTSHALDLMMLTLLLLLEMILHPSRASACAILKVKYAAEECELRKDIKNCFEYFFQSTIRSLNWDLPYFFSFSFPFLAFICLFLTSDLFIFPLLLLCYVNRKVPCQNY